MVVKKLVDNNTRKKAERKMKKKREKTPHLSQRKLKRLEFKQAKVAFRRGKRKDGARLAHLWLLLALDFATMIYNEGGLSVL